MNCSERSELLALVDGFKRGFIHRLMQVLMRHSL